MKVILLENIRKLGKLGQMVAVAPGFARNYLLPLGKALPATASNVAIFEAQRADLESRAHSRLAQATERAASYRDVVLLMKMKASAEGKLFGSVKATDIIEALLAKGHQVSKHEVRLEKVIREVGRYEYEIHVHPELILTLPVVVESDAAK